MHPFIVLWQTVNYVISEPEKKICDDKKNAIELTGEQTKFLAWWTSCTLFNVSVSIIHSTMGENR